MTSYMFETLERAREGLLDERDAEGVWRGCLSSSALSTATACAALWAGAQAWPERAAALLGRARAGQAWLVRNAGEDGGFGDTVDSPSNLSTTALAWMALGLELEPGRSGAGESGRVDPAAAEALGEAHGAAGSWLSKRVPSLDAPGLATALEAVYGEDKTFAVPILMALAAGGAFKTDERPWDSVPGLPFELAALPQGLFRFAGLPVVSYALPALIAIGQGIEHHRPSSNPLARWARKAARGTTLKRLESLQPENGGFLEATPLTSFVVLALCTAERGQNPVARKGLDFLESSMRPDGAWPIDTDLATWGTTLAVNALGLDGLAAAESRSPGSDLEPARAVLDWLLAQQHRVRHPYTGAAAGGWAWTDLPGGVPDADDTAGALLALRRLDPAGEETADAARRGLVWLRDLQNRDGGMPTFCRGFGSLPFDQSCADLTAHALRAMDAWGDRVDLDLAGLRARSLRFLVKHQRGDGAWLPLWFGNQGQDQRENPVYGTSRVLRAARVRAESGRDQALWNLALRRGLGWLLGAQDRCGGFGGDVGLHPSIEETGLALEALADAFEAGLGGSDLRQAGLRAANWLTQATRDGRDFPAQPIGLYFAQLWYHEDLYPRLFCVSGLARALEVFEA